MRCRSSSTRATAPIVPSSMSCRSEWRIKSTSTSRCSSRCRMLGIDQLFPVMPLEGLNKSPERRAVLLDITCDSDGAIDHYVDGDGIATTSADAGIRPGEPADAGLLPWLAPIRRILGNMHNLFGDTEAVDVFVFLTAALRLSCPTRRRYRSGYAASMCSWIRKHAADPVPRSGEKYRSGRCAAAAVPRGVRGRDCTAILIWKTSSR